MQFWGCCNSCGGVRCCRQGLGAPGAGCKRRAQVGRSQGVTAGAAVWVLGHPVPAPPSPRTPPRRVMPELGAAASTQGCSWGQLGLSRALPPWVSPLKRPCPRSGMDNLSDPSPVGPAAALGTQKHRHEPRQRGPTPQGWFGLQRASLTPSRGCNPPARSPQIPQPLPWALGSPLGARGRQGGGDRGQGTPIAARGVGRGARCPPAAPIARRCSTHGCRHPVSPQPPAPCAVSWGGLGGGLPIPPAPARAHVFPMWLRAPGSRRAQKAAPNSFPIE